LDWEPNIELDLDSYLITRTDPNNNSVTFTVDSATTEFMDNTAQPHTLYTYTVQAKDIDGNLSAPSPAVLGQLATHDAGILLVDDSKDGPGGNPLFPTDQQVDDYYDQILNNFTIARQWDVADSVNAGILMQDAHLGVYSTVIWHSDVRIPNNPISEDTVALRKYVENGGNLVMIGWQLMNSTSGDVAFSPGDFIHDIFFVDSVQTNPQLDFQGASPQLAGYPAVSVDSTKLPASFGGNLLSMEAFTALAGGTDSEVMYHYNSSSTPPSLFDGEPVALRHIATDARVIVIGFPLYFMEQPSAQQVITRALLDLGEITGIGEPSAGLESGKWQFELFHNYPNPFNPSTRITYQLPRSSEVELVIFDLLGQRVRTLVKGKQEPGTYKVQWDGRDDSGTTVASGIYLLRLSAGNFKQVQKMILLR